MRRLILSVLLLSLATPAFAQWRLSPAPRILIGSADGPEVEQFSNIMGVIRQSSGNLVVANMGSNQLRIFDSTGKHLRSVGRSGGGPGEFRQLFALYSGPADTIVAYDVAQGFHLFDPAGAYVRSIGYGRTAPSTMRVWAYGWFDDGTQLAGSPGARDRARQGRWFDSTSFFRMGANGERMAQVGRFPSIEFTGSTFGPMVVVFGPTLAVAVRGHRYCMGFSAEYQIRCADPDGGNPVVIRRASSPAAVDDQAIEQYRALHRALPMPGGGPVPERLKAQREAIARQTVFAARQPHFAHILLASDGELWVERYLTSDGMPRSSFLGNVAETPREWDVFDRNGVWRAAVTVPPRFKPMEVGAGYVLGIRLGEDDVEQVALYTVQRK